MLFYKIDSRDWSILTTFLVYLNRMPETIDQFGIKLSDITLDKNVIEALRKI